MALHDDALSKAKILLMSKPGTTFFITVLFSLRQVFDETIPTLATNGRIIKINPSFFLGLTPELRVSALMHEAKHAAYKHTDPSRKGDRDPMGWNVAADFVINLQLKRAGFQIGEGWLLDEQFDGMSTEQVYDALPKVDFPQPQFDDLEELPPTDMEEFRKEMDGILIRAALQADKAGESDKIPEALKVYIDKLLNPKLPWNLILRKYFNAMKKQDYSFKRPNRRFFPQFYLPSLYSEGIGIIRIYIDASASVSDYEFRRMVTEIYAIISQMRPEKIELAVFDESIRSEAVVRTVDQLMKHEFTGRHGTDIEVVIDHENENPAQVSLVFSDGEFGFPEEKEFKGDVVYLIYNNPTFTAPKGKVVHYEI